MAAFIGWLFRWFGGGPLLDWPTSKSRQGVKTKYAVKGKRKKKKRK